MAIDVVGSKMPPDNGYGQNGYAGPSSILPKDRDSGTTADPVRTRIESLGGKPVADVTVPDNVTARADADPANWQTRTVKADAYPAAMGNRARDDKMTFPTGNNYRPSMRPASAKHFQR